MPNVDLDLNYLSNAQSAIADINALAAAYKDLRGAINAANGSVDRLNNNMKAAGQAAQALRKGLDSVAGMATMANTSMGIFSTTAKAGRAAMSSAATAANRLGTNLTTVGANSTTAAAGLNAVGGAARGALPHTTGMGTSLGALGAKALIVSELKQLFSAILEESRKIEAYWMKMAQEAGVFRDSLRELASLQGQPGPNNQVYGDVLATSLAIGTTPEKAKEFMAAYENIAPAAREKGNFAPEQGQGTAEELEKGILVEAGQMGRRLGIDEKDTGEAVGGMALRHKLKSKEQAMDLMGGAMWGLQMGKMEYSKGVQALNKGMAKLLDPHDEEGDAAGGATAGRVGSIDEGGVYLGVLSLGTATADQAQHRMVQISRALNTTNQEAQAALAEMGVKADMSDPEKLIQLDKGLKAAGVGDRNTWLKQHKIGSDAQREGMVAAMKEAPVLEQRLKHVREHDFGKETIAADAQFRATDRTAIQQDAEAAAKARELTAGQVGEPLEMGKRFAHERAMRYDKDYRESPTASWMRWASGAATHFTSGVSGEEAYKESNEMYGAIPTLKRAAAEAGIDVDKQFPGINSSNPRERAAAFGKAAEAVEAKGGDPYGRKEVMKTAQQDAEKLKTETRGGPVNAPAKPGQGAAAGAKPGAKGVAAAGEKGVAVPAGEGGAVASNSVGSTDRVAAQAGSNQQAAAGSAGQGGNAAPAKIKAEVDMNRTNQLLAGILNAVQGSGGTSIPYPENLYGPSTNERA